MDPGLYELSGLMNGCRFDGSFSDHENEAKVFQLVDTHPNINYTDLPLVSPNSNPNDPLPVPTTSLRPESPEENLVFSDIALNYISNILMEEDMEDKISYVDPALKAAEKPFYDILGEKYPPSPDWTPSVCSGTQDSSSGVSGVDYEYPIHQIQNLPFDYSSLSSFGSLSSGGVVDSQPIWQYKRGVEEASKFLPEGLIWSSKPIGWWKLRMGGSTWAMDRRGEGRIDTRRMNEVSKNSQGGSNGGKSSRGKKQAKKEVVDLRTMLIHCAQAVAADDRRNAIELLKQIRKHSSPDKDGTQRLAYCFADGLEARLAGTGSEIYHSLVAKRTKATDILKAYHLYMAAAHSSLYRLSKRPGGPPKLRITGIDFPQPGFRPAERIEETGRRLADYAHSFNIPFEYNSIAAKWEDINVEDLKIDRDEVLVINSLRLQSLADETVIVDSPRNAVLSTIRKANPDLFIHGIVNGTYSSPFFVTRFREALFHFSSMFDMLESNVPQEHPERLLIERNIVGKQAMNVIACEGPEREERPETYKQWQVRVLRAGFTQLPLNTCIVKKAKETVKASYHKDFMIDEDGGWLLQGWKGRIMLATSTWRPNKISYSKC
ncbi:Scarecrow-like protein 9 [Acorus calamus]|uniref:Scarecrow-like protein 9 n=1 Tax=Acorus calamus TaxID=4465 RepID=A0AAV9DDM6_ACOCL|nr:Scarecrow-like protein 9 [Acorus calamus]